MTDNKPMPCRQGCGFEIYFDPQKKSASGKSIPLEMRGGVKSGEPHNCPNSTYNKNQKQKTLGGKTMPDAINELLERMDKAEKRIDNLELEKWKK